MHLGKLIAVCALLLCLSGCAVKWRGQPLLSADPQCDIWIHHPEEGAPGPGHKPE